jgi:NADH dehydrogenase
MKRFVLPKDYPELDFSKMNIYLLEGTAKTLGVMSEKSSEQSLKYLTELGVTVKTNTLIKDYDGKTAVMQDGSAIESSMLIWAAGIKGNVPAGISQDLIVRGNRIKVDRQCKVLGIDGVFAIGDVAYMEEPGYPKGHPQVAPVAMQQADMLVNNLMRIEMKSSKKLLLDFEYHDKGAMATVGRNLAVVDMPKPKLHFGGILAWFIWMSLHLMLILGVKNRFFVFINWLTSYFTRDQNLRLIFLLKTGQKNR